MNTEDMETFELDNMDWVRFKVRRTTGSNIFNRMYETVGIPVPLVEGGQEQLEEWRGILLEGNVRIHASRDKITVGDDEITIVAHDGDDRKQVVYLTPVYENKCQGPEVGLCTV